MPIVGAAAAAGPSGSERRTAAAAADVGGRTKGNGQTGRARRVRESPVPLHRVDQTASASGGSTCVRAPRPTGSAWWNVPGTATGSVLGDGEIVVVHRKPTEEPAANCVRRAGPFFLTVPTPGQPAGPSFNSGVNSSLTPVILVACRHTTSGGRTGPSRNYAVHGRNCPPPIAAGIRSNSRSAGIQGRPARSPDPAPARPGGGAIRTRRSSGRRA